MKIIKKTTEKNNVLKACFSETKTKEKIIKKSMYISDFCDSKVSYIYLGKKEDYSRDTFEKAVEVIVQKNICDYEIDLSSFVDEEKEVKECTSVRTFASQFEYFNDKKTLYSAKTIKINDNVSNIDLISENPRMETVLSQAKIFAHYTNLARKFQAMPPNECTSEWLGAEMGRLLKEKKSSKISFKVLNKYEITQEKMNLFLSVNKGSAHEARLVVAEYKGNPGSKEKIAYIGKGIIFDSGGYNLKGARVIQGMKYDMSGAAICFAAFMAITELNPDVNISIVLPLTDNKISSDANLPDAIWKSMNGKTVEINNTDAEGRLVLADAITYAIRKLNSTQIVDVATLTGAMVVSLGTTFTGGWSTCDKNWELFVKASKKYNELVWRMPFHSDFAKNIKKSNFADLKNTDLTGKGGSNSAAMFLKEFIEDNSYIHLDVAGTAGVGDNPTGIMVKTLAQYALIKGNNENNACSTKETK